MIVRPDAHELILGLAGGYGGYSACSEGRANTASDALAETRREFMLAMGGDPGALPPKHEARVETVGDRGQAQRPRDRHQERAKHDEERPQDRERGDEEEQGAKQHAVHARRDRNQGLPL